MKQRFRDSRFRQTARGFGINLTRIALRSFGSSLTLGHTVLRSFALQRRSFWKHSWRAMCFWNSCLDIASWSIMWTGSPSCLEQYVKTGRSYAIVETQKSSKALHGQEVISSFWSGRSAIVLYNSISCIIDLAMIRCGCIVQELRMQSNGFFPDMPVSLHECNNHTPDSHTT